MNREIERYNLLEQKFRDLLIKFNVLQKENQKNKELVFKMQTGANFPKYDNFLDADREFSSKKKARHQTQGEDDLGRDLDDELDKMREAMRR